MTGHQMRGGFLKYYILKLLGEEPLTGYGLMKRIGEETGFWKPSTGSMYPLLQALEDQGMIAHEGETDRKVYRLTEQGRTALAEAHQAKAEILRNLQRACDVFSRIFGKEEVKGLKEQMQSWFQGEEGAPHRFPESLRPRVFLLRRMLLSLPYERLSQGQLKKINEILEGTLAQLSEFVE